MGLFVDADPDDAAALARTLRLDYVQLHKTAPAVPGVRRIVAVRSLAEVEADAVLLDPSEGSGRVAEWDVLPPRTLLAGGLTAANDGEAIRAAAPWGVDVSSGIEGDVKGEKDEGRMRAFVEAVRETDRSLEAEG